MEFVPCNNCNQKEFRPVLEKASAKGDKFQVQKCKNCGLLQTNPRPTFSEILEYYSSEYFHKRTERGYDNYYSSEVRAQIERVLLLNLNDLKFFDYEKTLSDKKVLDIGCAYGYFLNLLKGRGWDTLGIDIAGEPVQLARERLSLNVIQDNFLEWDKKIQNKFHLITLWASLEHLHYPKETLQKIYKHLHPNGRIILSTCRYGILAKLQGANWRYMNVPEHLYFYTLKQLKEQLEKIGFQFVAQITYGSGLTTKKNASFFYNISKKILDSLVKVLGQGDMMALHFKK